jgi:hypothetical protein
MEGGDGHGSSLDTAGFKVQLAWTTIDVTPGKINKPLAINFQHN